MSVDVEDLVRKQKFDSKIDKKMLPIYENIIHNLYAFMNTHYEDNHFKKKFLKEFQRIGRKNKIQIKKSDIVGIYKKMIEKNEIENDPFFWKCIQKKPVRNTSSVNPITLMYSPYPNGQDFTCRFKCKYCQTHPDYPKSYGPEAPASARGISNNFDAISQMNSNLDRLSKNGHELDKLEMNYEGGTFSEIPLDYLEKFHRDTYYAANVYFDKVYREPLSIEEEMKINETAKIHIIGMTIETRPDTIDKEQLVFFRKLGVTRVQIGVQHTNNNILKKSARGHTYQDAVEATHILKSNGFKVVHHYMTALPYAKPEDDLKMIDTVYSSSRGRPHEIKIYPFSVVPYSDFEKEYIDGKFTLYSDQSPEVFKIVMTEALKNCPMDIRIDRAVRDIPSTYILGGCNTPNLRQIITDDLQSKGEECNDIRSREISRRDSYKFQDSKYFTTYLNDNDIFISLESQDRRALFGYLRLRLNNTNEKVYFKELDNCAIIEELHVYSTGGMLVPVGKTKKGSSQHRGVGKNLIKQAEWISWFSGYSKIAVISGEGVRTYYNKLGYCYSNNLGRFMIKNFYTKFITILKMILFNFISLVILSKIFY